MRVSLCLLALCLFVISTNAKNYRIPKALKANTKFKANLLRRMFRQCVNDDLKSIKSIRDMGYWKLCKLLRMKMRMFTPRFKEDQMKDGCPAKTITSLADLRGMLPEENRQEIIGQVCQMCNQQQFDGLFGENGDGIHIQLKRRPGKRTRPDFEIDPATIDVGEGDWMEGQEVGGDFGKLPNVVGSDPVNSDIKPNKGGPDADEKKPETPGLMGWQKRVGWDGEKIDGMKDGQDIWGNEGDLGHGKMDTVGGSLGRNPDLRMPPISGRAPMHRMLMPRIASRRMPVS